MIIRHAKRDEYGTIASLIEEAFRDSAVSLGHEVQFVEILRSSDAYIPGLEYVAVDDDSGLIVGHIILSVLPISHGNSSIRGLLLAPLSVRPEFQHRGIGTATARMFVEFGLNTLRLHRISLRVIGGNDVARRSYEKAGFATEGVFRDMVKLDGEFRDVVFMSILSERSGK